MSASKKLEGEAHQVIDGNGAFTGQLQRSLEEWKFTKKGLNYSVTAVLGPQSSGKSTLLNLLFQTDFQTMDAASGRQQTTKGLWVGKASGLDCLVFDVEGTDSKERAEDDFERKASLFSLALAEVLIVNMWASDIGRFNASNYGLIKTVFSVYLQLFHNDDSPKTLLLFVIRDHSQKNPLEKLKEIVMGDLHKLWNELEKPKKFVNSRVTDCFLFDFVALAHYEYQRPEFDRGVERLHERFAHPDQDDFVFKATNKKCVPADGLSKYAESIWRTIQENKDLHLPTQREMLAMYRCDSISADLLTTFVTACQEWEARLESHEVISDLGAAMSELFEDLFSLFDAQTQLYHKDTVQTRRTALRDKSLSDLGKLYKLQVNNALSTAIRRFKKRLSEDLPRDAAVDNFASAVEGPRRDAVSFFEDTAQASVVRGSGWSFQGALDVLHEELKTSIEEERVRQISLAKTEMQNTIKQRFKTLLRPIVDAAKPNMWEAVQAAFESVRSEIADLVMSKARGFELPSEEAEQWEVALNEHAVNEVREQIREAARADVLLHRMRKRFDDKFKFDDKRLPVIWKIGDDIEGRYTEARDDALKILEIFSRNGLRLNAPAARDSSRRRKDAAAGAEGEGVQSLDPRDEILSAEECLEIQQRFEAEIQGAYLEARRQQDNAAGGGQIPWWVGILIVVLGFNEFVMLVQSPFLLLALVFFGATVYFLHMFGMLGPATAVGGAVMRQVAQQMQEFMGGNRAATPGRRTRAGSRGRPSPAATRKED